MKKLSDYRLRQLFNPEWEKAGRVHDWRNHISDGVRCMWASFTMAQRQALMEQAVAEADQEEWD